MATGKPEAEGADPTWASVRGGVARAADREALLRPFLRITVLDHDRLEDALVHILAEKLASPSLTAMALREAIDEALRKARDFGAAVRADLRAVVDRDPACTGPWVPLLYYKGFHALQTHRVAHWLQAEGRTELAMHLQNRCSEVFGVDIHPAARIGSGIFIDHATSVVIGETAVVEDDVSMLHEVTLGGTGKETGDRHPKVRRGVLICAGAKVLGNVELGEGSKVAAGSVVLHDVPPHCTVAGVPAVVVGRPASDQPALEMDAGLPGEGEGWLGEGI
jgi:serine O-acetyltransferase